MDYKRNFSLVHADPSFLHSFEPNKYLIVEQVVDHILTFHMYFLESAFGDSLSRTNIGEVRL